MNPQTARLTRLVLLIAITLIIEMIGLPQFFTGPLVNMMLVLTTLISGVTGGMALGCITPLIALLRGQLPPVLAPFVPFILAGNALYVLLFGALRGRLAARPLYSWRAWLGIVVGSAGKFLWLLGAARLLMPLLLSRSLPPAVIAMMTLPQLITALLGGLLALLFYALLVRRRILSLPE
ncbi:MAG TPA: ECF transporter S component [bacterium]|nr:ECF transporter S component [bacterium]